MTNVYFVRHAEPDYNVRDDFARLSSYLSDKDIHVVISSPYLRAIDTVKDFAGEVGLDIKIVDDFRERKVGNVWIEDFNSFAKKQWEDFDYFKIGI